MKAKFFDGPLDGLEADVPESHEAWRFTKPYPEYPPIGVNTVNLWPSHKGPPPGQSVYLYIRDFKGDMIYQGLDNEDKPQGE